MPLEDLARVAHIAARLDGARPERRQAGLRLLAALEELLALDAASVGLDVGSIGVGVLRDCRIRSGAALDIAGVGSVRLGVTFNVAGV